MQMNTGHLRGTLKCRDKPANAAEATADLADWIRQRYKATDSGIVYCQTRKDCETLAAELTECGMLAAYYHADMNPAMREGVHLQWSKGEAGWFCTSAASEVRTNHGRCLRPCGGCPALSAASKA